MNQYKNMTITIDKLFFVFVFLLHTSLQFSTDDDSTLTYQKFLFKSPFKLKQAAKLKEPNDEKEIYYSMKNAINYLFQKIQNETTDISFYPSGDFTLEPKNIVFLQPKCEKVSEQSTLDRNPFLLYEDCSILIIMKQLSIKNSNRVIATFQDYLAEFSFETLNFTLFSNNTIGISYLQAPTINYNKAESLFNIPSLSSQLNQQMVEIGTIAFARLINSFNAKAGQGQELYLEGFLGSVFNVLYMNGPFINVNETEEEKKTKDTKDKVTYISYSNPKFDFTVLTKDVIFIGMLQVGFDFALDYDINYNEGYMKLSDFVFSKDLGGAHSDRAITFNPLFSNSSKFYILQHFNEQLEIARKNYTQIGEKAQEDEPY